MQTTDCRWQQNRCAARLRHDKSKCLQPLRRPPKSRFAQASTTRISETFKNATRGEQGACLLSVVAMNRTMQRWRRGKTPPPPLDAIDADRFLRDDQYRDSVYAKHYIGLVQGDEGEYALLFGSRENLNYLGAQTKLIQVDGTFRTAPATSRGRFYQNLMFHAKFKAHAQDLMIRERPEPRCPLCREPVAQCYRLR